MDAGRLEALIASIDFEPPAPLTDEEREAWDFFVEAAMKLRQISTAKRGARNAKQRLKNRGHVSSVAPTDRERVNFDARTSAVTTRLKELRKKHDEQDLENRREYEINKTRWMLIEEHLLTEDVRVIYCYSQAQLDNALATYLHPTSDIVALFIDRQRLTDQERAEFLVEASEAHEDRRSDD